MGFYRSPCHLELGGDFSVVTTLQKQFNHLLFARTEAPNGLVLHLIPLFLFYSLGRSGARPTFSENSFLFPYIKRPIVYQNLGESTRVGRYRTTSPPATVLATWPQAILMNKSQFDWKRD